MVVQMQKKSSVLLKMFATLGLVAALGACARPDLPSRNSDPFENQNRATYESNLALDRGVIRPASQVYGRLLPEPIRQGVGNFAANLSLPSLVVNKILQGDVEGAGKNGMRFLFNTVFGLGGVLDPASDAGLFAADTDFGETLYKWGVPEGNYVVLPVIGPSTERHFVGRVVDLFTNPVTAGLPAPEKYWDLGTKVASRLGERYRFSDSVDSIYYDSADGYNQARLLYLQHRRYNLGVSVVEKSGSIFNELYGQ